MADRPSPDGALGRVQSLVRAFGILDLLGEHIDGLGLAQIARETGLAKTTAHRLLTTMDSLDYVTFDRQTNLWSVGVRTFAVGSSFARSRDVGRLSHPYMRALMLDVQETVNLATIQHDMIAYVSQVAARSAPSTFARPGLKLPVHCTAVGKAMAAHWTGNRIDGFLGKTKLRPVTSHTITATDRLNQQFGEIRARGYAIDVEENAAGTVCIAAPIFDERKEPIASISISGSARHLVGARIDRLGHTVSRIAGKITGAIGGCAVA